MGSVHLKTPLFPQLSFIHLFKCVYVCTCEHTLDINIISLTRNYIHALDLQSSIHNFISFSKSYTSLRHNLSQRCNSTSQTQDKTYLNITSFHILGLQRYTQKHTKYYQVHQINTATKKVYHTTQEQFIIRITQYKQLTI